MWELYLISVLGTVHIISTICAIPSLVITIALFFGTADDLCCGEYNKTLCKWTKISFVVSCFLVSFSIFIPSKKDMYLIFGLGSTIDYIQDSDKAKELPEKTIMLINQTLDKLIEEK